MKRYIALLLALICCFTTGCSNSIDCLDARKQSTKFVQDYLSCGTNATYQKMLKKYKNDLDPELYSQMLTVPESCLGSLDSGYKDHIASVTNINVYSKDSKGNLEILSLEDSANVYHCEVDALLRFRGQTDFGYKITVVLDKSGTITDFVVDFLQK